MSLSAIGCQWNVLRTLDVSIVLALGLGLPGLPRSAFGNTDLTSSGAYSKYRSSRGWYDESAVRQKNGAWSDGEGQRREKMTNEKNATQLVATRKRSLPALSFNSDST